MCKNVKVVIGANYGDEGKGMMTRYFVTNSEELPIVVFHNGTAQRGHTVDYSEDFKHVYHHFGSGTADGSSTYFADTFLVHPMEFYREYTELYNKGIKVPLCFCNPNAKVITPFDMVVDRAFEENFTKVNGEKEYASCMLGSWCAAEDRIPLGRTAYSISDFKNIELIPFLMEEIWKDCISILNSRGIDIESTSFSYIIKNKNIIVHNFTKDLEFFFSKVKFVDFDTLWEEHNSFVFETGQGLGLDKDVDNRWHTTSSTGVMNPFNMLKDKSDFNAEVCYVTRSYLTRHGAGPLEEQVDKREINDSMVDSTNVYTEFVGSLRYGFLEKQKQKQRIEKDWSIVGKDNRFKKSIAVTHCNEFENTYGDSKYVSSSKFSVKELR